MVDGGPVIRWELSTAEMTHGMRMQARGAYVPSSGLQLSTTRMDHRHRAELAEGTKRGLLPPCAEVCHILAHVYPHHAHDFYNVVIKARPYTRAQGCL